MDRKIWVNKAPAIIKPTRELNIEVPKVQLEGRFQVQLIRKGIILKELNFKNLIVNAGLDLFSYGGASLNSTPDGAFTYLSVGTGNVAPAAADINLAAPLSPRTNRNGGQVDVTGSDGTGHFSYIRRTRLFLETEVNGNLAELGFFTALTLGAMVNRQLFKDDLGNNVVITKTVQDQLKVTFEWRMYYPTVNATGTVNLAGTNYDYTVQADGGLDTGHWGSGNGATRSLGANGGGPQSTAYQTVTLAADAALVSNKTGTLANASTDTLQPYSAGTFQRDEIAIWDPGTANITGGIQGVSTFNQSTIGGTVSHDNLFIIKFVPAIPKIATQRLTLNLRRTWGRFP